MAATDDFANMNAGLHSPCQQGAAVTTSDNNDLTDVTRAIYVGGAGDLVVNMQGLLGEAGATLTFKAVPVGTWLWIRATRVKATGTTATNILALW